MRDQTALDSRMAAVLARLCDRLGSLSKTQAVKLPYIVDVVAMHVRGDAVTGAEYEAWDYGVVAPAVWHAFSSDEAKASGRVNGFSVRDLPYSESGVAIRLEHPSSAGLSDAEGEIVDDVAEMFGKLGYEELGKLTKAMNLEIRKWGSNRQPRIDEEAYVRLVGRWDSVLSKVEADEAEDEQNWGDLTGAPTAELRKSLGV